MGMFFNEFGAARAPLKDTEDHVVRQVTTLFRAAAADGAGPEELRAAAQFIIQGIDVVTAEAVLRYGMDRRKELERHTHLWNDNDYCGICGAERSRERDR